MQFSTITTLLFAGVAAAMPQQATSTSTSSAAAPSATCTPGPVVDYTVQSNDTLTIVSQKLNSGICNIATLNNLARPDFIAVGAVLKVPTAPCVIDNVSCLAKPSDNNTCATGVSPYYTIASGDTFFLVAQKFNLSVEALQAANPGVDPLLLQIGQVINIPICN
ncbi:uncharacterized protein PpBr36_06758 [Pyricularia pennisetigena]|uniref:uncharacterized protein n=1 Tax=Pyricularia pennisetigena TaxID=1578925 RepID=UPI00114EB0D9|nr:uncharacterized protein PpBr36_06758 [Pyricularia pennisetigena]TLS23202.1 hypothetical protein PpBr36_06758 [Pyricularia pennisetigena]